MADGNPGLVEMAGLPGAGKTTVARTLVRRLPDSRISFFATHKTTLRVLRLIWLATPFTQARFKDVLTRLGDLDPTARRDILYLLNVFLTELALARIEARLRGRALVLDEGFVQRGLGLCLRAPKAIREDLWQRYVACLPADLFCLVLDVEPDTAALRASARKQGAPEVFDTDQGSPGPGNGTASDRYAESRRLLAGPTLRQSVRCSDIPASENVEDLAGRVLGELESLWPRERVASALFFVREADFVD